MLADEPTRDGPDSNSPAAAIQYIGNSDQLPLEIIQEVLIVHLRSLKAQLPPPSAANPRATAQTFAPILTTWRCSNIARVFRAILDYYPHVTLDTAARLGDLNLFKTLVAVAADKDKCARVLDFSDDWLVLAAKGGNLALFDEWWKMECSPTSIRWFVLSTYRAQAMVGDDAFKIQVCNAEQHAQIVLNACERGNIPLLEWLVGHGIDRLQVTQGMLNAASANGHHQVLQFLAQFMAADTMYSFSGHALDAACAHGYLGVLGWWSEPNLAIWPTKSAFLATLQSASSGTISPLAAKETIMWLKQQGLFSPARPSSSSVARIVLPRTHRHIHLVKWLLNNNLLVVTPHHLARALLATPLPVSLSIFQSWFGIMCTRTRTHPSGNNMSPLYASAAAIGDTRILSFLQAKVAHPRFDGAAALVAAAQGGHTETLTYCLTRLRLSPGLDVLKRVMNAALANGHVNVLNWCRIAFSRTPPSWIPVSEAAVTAAASGGHLEAIEWWIAELRGRELDDAGKVIKERFNSASVLSAGLKNGRMAMVEWFIRFKRSDRHRHPMTLMPAIANGHLDAVKRYFELYRIPGCQYFLGKRTAKKQNKVKAGGRLGSIQNTWFLLEHDKVGRWRTEFVVAASRAGRVDLLRWMSEQQALGDAKVPTLYHQAGESPDASLRHAGLEAALVAYQAECVAFWVGIFGQHGQLPRPMADLFANPATRLTVLGLCVAHPAVLSNVALASAGVIPVAIATGEVGFLDRYHRSVSPRLRDTQIPVLASAAGQIGVLVWWLESCYAVVARDPALVAVKRQFEEAAAAAYEAAVAGGIRSYHVARWWLERSGVALGVDAATHDEIWAPVLAAGPEAFQPEQGEALAPPADVWEASDNEGE